MILATKFLSRIGKLCSVMKLRPVQAGRKNPPGLRLTMFRSCRLAMNLELMRAGFPTVIIPVEDRAAYYENLDKAGKDANYGPFVQQLGQLVAQSFDPYWYLLGIA